MIPVHTPHGFNWGPLRVTRIAHFEPRKGREAFILSVNDLEIYVSKTGRSVRVFRDGKSASNVRALTGSGDNDNES